MCLLDNANLLAEFCSDGMKGVITYRGYSIDDIISNGKNFIDTVHLLVWGRWPSKEAATKLQEKITIAMRLEESVYNVIRSFPYAMLDAFVVF